jgi:hypothetical protein
MTRPLSTIANEIILDWKPMSPYAIPYVGAMVKLNTLDDKYGCDDAPSIVRYFLSNSGTWRGPVARRIKIELAAMLINHAKGVR